MFKYGYLVLILVVMIVGCGESEPATNYIVITLTDEQVAQLTNPQAPDITSLLNYSFHPVCDDWGRVCELWSQAKLKMQSWGYIRNNSKVFDYQIVGVKVNLFVPGYEGEIYHQTTTQPVRLDSGQEMWYKYIMYIEFESPAVNAILTGSLGISYEILAEKI